MNPGDMVLYTNVGFDPRTKMMKSPQIGIVLSEATNLRSSDLRFYRVLTATGAVKLCNEAYVEVLQ